MPDYGEIFNPYPGGSQELHKGYYGVPGAGAQDGFSVNGRGVPNPETELLRRPTQPSQMGDVVLYSLLRDWFAFDAQHSYQWRMDAKKEFGFVANEQWDPADKRELEDAGRVAITFNRTLSIIKSVAGIEINGRHETAYLPRNNTTESAEVNEMLTEASNWMADGCDAEDEQSDAFQDCCICGMGWTEMRLDFEEEPEGRYVEERIDPLEMIWDSSARAKNLTDARRVWRVRKMMLSEARDRFPGVPDVDLDASWARSMGHMNEPAKPVEDRLRREENLAFDYDPKTEVHIVQVQWWERETYWRVIDPMQPNAKPFDLTVPEFERLKERYDMLGRELIALELKRRIYKQAFLGGAILGGVKPCPVKDRFTFQCITGERDRNKGVWFGLVRLMHDPQMWANKWLSQSLHILNTTAKGGILAEEDAFVDQREAEETYALPDAITWVRQGAIAGNKIMQKPGGGIPTPYINLLQFAISSIRDVVGINLELLGMRDVNQPGILEAQRKQAAMTILATLFDSLRRYRKQVGRVRLFFIQNYLADGRWIRITGPEGHKFTRLIREETLGDYDVIIDDAPTSPNQKEKSWSIIQMMLPAIRDILTPEIVVMILEYSPLPAKLVSSLKDMLKEPNPEQQQAQQLEMANAQAEIAKLQSEAQKNQATAQKMMIEARGAAAEAGAQQGAEPRHPVEVQKDLATIEKDRAQAARLRAQTILDFANAASETSRSMLDNAKAAYINADAQSRGLFDMDGEEALSTSLFGRLDGMEEQFATPNSFSGLPTPPSIPQLPNFSQGGQPSADFPPREIGGGGGLLSIPMEIPSGVGGTPDPTIGM